MGEHVPGLGRNPELKQAAFRLEAGQTADRIFSTEAGAAVVRVRTKTLPPEDGFEAEKEGLRQQLVQAKQQEAFKGFIQELKGRYSVSVDRDLFETL